MPEGSSGPEPDPADAPQPAGGSANDGATPADRRTFLRQLSTDAVRNAGRVAGASAAFRRSIVAAGGSALGAFDTSVEPDAADAVAAPAQAAAAGETTAPGRPPVTTQPAIPTSPSTHAPDPVTALTPEQHAFLHGMPKAALAVNDPAGPPLLAYSTYHWDGEVIRVPARDFTARTNNIDLDRRVGLLIDDPASDAWVAMNGIASLVYGEQVEAEMRLILAKYHDGDEVTRRWNEIRSTGDQVVIRIRPTRFVWRTG